VDQLGWNAPQHVPRTPPTVHGEPFMTVTGRGVGEGVGVAVAVGEGLGVGLGDGEGVGVPNVGDADGGSGFPLASWGFTAMRCQWNR